MRVCKSITTDFHWALFYICVPFLSGKKAFGYFNGSFSFCHHQHKNQKTKQSLGLPFSFSVSQSNALKVNCTDVWIYQVSVKTHIKFLFIRLGIVRRQRPIKKSHISSSDFLDIQQKIPLGELFNFLENSILLHDPINSC